MLTAIFEHRLERTFDPDTKKWVVEVVETIGEVQAPNYPAANIPFRFDALPPPDHLDVSVSPSSAVIAQPVALTVLAKDAATGRQVDGSVTINATIIGPTGVPLPYTFTDLNASGSVNAPGYPPARIPWTLEPHGAMQVTVNPPKLRVGVPTQFVIRTVDDRTGQPIAGTVILDSTAIGATNTPLTATFTHNVNREFDPDIKKWTTTVTETIGFVDAPLTRGPTSRFHFRPHHESSVSDPRGTALSTATALT